MLEFTMSLIGILKKLALRFPAQIRTINRVRNMIASIGCAIGIQGLDIIRVNSNGNTILRFNRSYPLGNRGSNLQIPRDSKIFEHVRRYGSWELRTSKFIAKGIENQSLLNKKIAVIDIGAHTGLITLQIFRITNVDFTAFLFEPLPKNADAIRYNLDGKNVKIFEVLLDKENGAKKIFTQKSNIGNSSIFKQLIPEHELIENVCTTVDVRELFNSSVNMYECYMIKCDIQGMDSMVLSRIPNDIWQKTDRAVIEVWATETVENRDVESLVAKLSNFKYLSWQQNLRELVSISDVSNFWLSKSGEQKNLFMSKNVI